MTTSRPRSPGLDDLRPDLPGAGHRQGPRPADRPGGDRPGRARRPCSPDGVLTMHDAARAVDYETIVLLFGMMVVVAYLRLAGLLRPGDRTDRRTVLRAIFAAGA